MQIRLRLTMCTLINVIYLLTYMQRRAAVCKYVAQDEASSGKKREWTILLRAGGGGGGGGLAISTNTRSA